MKSTLLLLDITKINHVMLQYNREYGPIDKTLDILKVGSEGKYLDVLEIFYIYKAEKCSSGTKSKLMNPM
jgi:hypothetical protein